MQQTDVMDGYVVPITGTSKQDNVNPWKGEWRNIRHKTAICWHPTVTVPEGLLLWITCITQVYHPSTIQSVTQPTAMAAILQIWHFARTQTHLALYADDTALILQSWLPDTISFRLNDVILHYVETLIQHPQNWNHIIFQVLSPPPGPYSNPAHLCALGLDLPLSRPCARFKTSLQPAPAHRHQ